MDFGFWEAEVAELEGVIAVRDAMIGGGWGGGEDVAANHDESESMAQPAEASAPGWGYHGTVSRISGMVIQRGPPRALESSRPLILIAYFFSG